MKTNTIGRSLVQTVMESQTTLDTIKRNITEMCDKYEVVRACLSGISNDIYKDNLTRGYFEILENYDSILSALKDMKLGHKLLIREGNYHLGLVRNSINECSKDSTVINLYSNRIVKEKEGAIKMCDLDNIHTPQQMMALYEKVAEQSEELKTVLENLKIEIPETNPDMDSRKWITETWEKIHEALENKEMTFTELAYTEFLV